jgi:hypothetical protein
MMKSVILLTVTLFTTSNAFDIKERLRELRDPENVNPDVSETRIACVGTLALPYVTNYTFAIYTAGHEIWRVSLFPF